MISVQMPIASSIALPELLEDCFLRWIAKLEPFPLFHDRRNPATALTSPSITLEAQQPEPTVHRIIVTRTPDVALLVDLAIALDAVFCASSTTID